MPQRSLSASPADPPAPSSHVLAEPDGPVYERDALSLGPFEDEPMQMWRLVERRADGSERPGKEVVACSTGWMVAALEAAGVELGEFDRVVAALLASEGWSLVQTVAGWVGRANGGIES